jgi:hypothetical protein
MTEPDRRAHEPLPLRDVYDIVERRRRQRTRNRALIAPAAAVGAAGLAGLLVVAIQSGGSPGAPAASPQATVATAPTTDPTTELVPTTGPTPTPRAKTAPPFDAGWLQPDLLPGLANSMFDGPEAQQTRLLDEATALADAWQVPMYPVAKAVVTKADLLDTPLNSTDPHGADKLIRKFESSGYTADYAAELARAWDTDPRSAEIVGGLVIEAGCCG